MPENSKTQPEVLHFLKNYKYNWKRAADNKYSSDDKYSAWQPLVSLKKYFVDWTANDNYMNYIDPFKHPGLGSPNINYTEYGLLKKSLFLYDPKSYYMYDYKLGNGTEFGQAIGNIHQILFKNWYKDKNPLGTKKFKEGLVEACKSGLMSLISADPKFNPETVSNYEYYIYQGCDFYTEYFSQIIEKITPTEIHEMFKKISEFTQDFCKNYDKAKNNGKLSTFSDSYSKNYKFSEQKITVRTKDGEKAEFINSETAHIVNYVNKSSAPLEIMKHIRTVISEQKIDKLPDLSSIQKSLADYKKTESQYKTGLIEACKCGLMELLAKKNPSDDLFKRFDFKLDESSKTDPNAIFVNQKEFFSDHFSNMIDGMPMNKVAEMARDIKTAIENGSWKNSPKLSSHKVVWYDDRKGEEYLASPSSSAVQSHIEWNIDNKIKPGLCFRNNSDWDNFFKEGFNNLLWTESNYTNDLKDLIHSFDPSCYPGHITYSNYFENDMAY